MSSKSVTDILLEDVTESDSPPKTNDKQIKSKTSIGNPPQKKQPKHNQINNVNMAEGKGQDEVDFKLKMPCLHTRACKIFLLLLILGLDLADLLSDWLLYIDVSIVEQGLVYGPPEQSEIIALLVFSILGTFTFFFETINMIKEFTHRTTWLDVDLVSAITLWIEDVPQIIINVFIALCREDPISVFQLTKASIILFGIFIRIVVSLARYCSKKALIEARQHTPESRRHVAYRVFIVLGLLVNFACAVCVFVFTQTQRDLDGNLHFQIPKTIFQDRFNDERYFSNVSIYFHHSSFDFETGKINESSAHWMRLTTVNSLRNKVDKNILFKYDYYQTGPNEVKMTLWDNTNGNWEAKECYTLDKGAKTITAANPCQSFLTGSMTSIIFNFTFEPPNTFFRRLIFGDIKFNVKLKNDTTCTEVSDIAEAISKSPQQNVPAIHYYRTNRGETNHLILANGRPRFYEMQQNDLTDISVVWQTGWKHCESTGSLAPHVDSTIIVPCQ